MTLTRMAFAGVLLLQACRVPSGLPERQILRYGVHSHFSGSVALTVDRDGAAEYDETGGQPGPDVHVRGRIESAELYRVAEVLRQNDFCSLRSGRSTGVPDEAMPSIAVRTDGLDCLVSLWDNEFSDNPKARASLAAVEELGRSLKARSASGTSSASTPPPHP